MTLFYGQTLLVLLNYLKNINYLISDNKNGVFIPMEVEGPAHEAARQGDQLPHDPAFQVKTISVRQVSH